MKPAESMENVSRRAAVEHLNVKLEVGSIDPAELSAATLRREIERSRTPARLLRKLVSVFEAQRMAHKLGWPRPWNRDGLTVFRSFNGDPGAIGPGLDFARDLLLLQLEAVPLYIDFVQDLWRDPQRSVLVFCHNHRRDGDFHEGLTLSVGRKVAEDTGKCDRVDIVLEDRLENGCVDGRVDRVRLYVNPWFDYRYDRVFKTEITSENRPMNPLWQQLYARILAFYAEARENPRCDFEPWSIRYEEHFGARDFIPPGTRFL